MNYAFYILFALMFLTACNTNEEPKSIKNSAPATSDQGRTITFQDEKSISFFETETISKKDIESELKAPGKIAANIFRSAIGASQNVILFDDADLSNHYTQLMHHQINIRQIKNVNIKQKELEVERIKNLQEYGASTGQELLAAETELSIEKSNLANERASLIEHETQLKSGGFSAKMLQNSNVGTAYLIATIPENQIGILAEGQKCRVIFPAFPADTITGEIDGFTDRIDSRTRMLKVRIIINNSTGKFKTGMFANVAFGTSQSDIITIDQNALVTIKGNHYAFVKKSANTFERRLIQTGQQIGSRITVFGGLSLEEQIAIKGVMQLKGLSFGY